MRTYEVIFIIRPDIADDDVKVVILDDVLTTGATMVAAAEALKAAGAVEVAFATEHIIDR